MKHNKFSLIMIAVVVLASVYVFAGDAKVIANPNVTTTSVSADDLRSVFLEEKNSFSDGAHVEPVLQKSGAAHEAFVKDYLGKNDSVLQTYYRSLVFTGKGSMPKTVGSDAEVVAYVAKTKGAVGYVSASASTEGVKVLQVK